MPVCFSDEMRNSRGALTPPTHTGARKPCPARLALLLSGQPSSNGSGQPYTITILLEERSMSNPCPAHEPTLGPPTLSFSVGRGGIADTLSGQRGTHQFLNTDAALGIFNVHRFGGAVARQGLLLAA